MRKDIRRSNIKMYRDYLKIRESNNIDIMAVYPITERLVKILDTKNIMTEYDYFSDIYIAVNDSKSYITLSNNRFSYGTTLIDNKILDVLILKFKIKWRLKNVWNVIVLK